MEGDFKSDGSERDLVGTIFFYNADQFAFRKAVVNGDKEFDLQLVTATGYQGKILNLYYKLDLGEERIGLMDLLKIELSVD